jgi:hypothetical protein
VWYTVIGTGGALTASLCTAPTMHDTQLSVFSGVDCQAAQGVCVGGNDDYCGFQSEVTWCAQAGVTYHILVHGYGGEVGPFDVDLRTPTVSDCNGTGVPDVCESVTGGDFNVDGAVDDSDFQALTECFDGPNMTPALPPLECLPTYLRAFDSDGDGDVDLLDVATFQRAFTG